MTTATFFENFHQFIDTYYAIPKMRELILELAVQGKLVNQNPSEGNSDALLSQIRERNAPSKTGEEFAVSAASVWRLPDSWNLSTLGEVCTIIRGVSFPGDAKTKEKEQGAVACLRTASVQAEIDWDDLIYISQKHVGRDDQWVMKDDIMISMANSYALVGKVAIVRDLPQKTTFGAFLAAIRPVLVDPFFLLYALRSPRMQAAFRESSSQTTNIANISLSKMRPLPFPLPPLTEQRRIVAKVNELMAVCDHLQAQQKEREARQAALRHAVVARFNEEPTGDNLNLLFHKSYSISASDLRRVIANLALHGKLVPRSEYAESVDLLLAKLQDERHRYATKYGFRTNDPRKDKADNPYSIPNHWRWVNLSDLFYAVTDGDHLPPPKSSDGIAFLTIGNITTGQLDFSEVRYVPKHYYDALAEYRQPRNGDFLYTVVGATYGRPAPVDATRPFCVQRHIAILKPCQSTNRAFLSLLLKSPLVYEQAKASTTGTAQPTIPLGALRRFQVPLPPLSEQDRIARRVSELIALVDTMDEQLRRTEAMSEELLDAFIHLVLHPDEEVANNHKHDNASARAAIGCYAIRSLTQNASFGRTMLMKVFYLSEAHAGILQGWQPMRQAAGPYDPAIEDFESLGIQSGWFTVKTKTLSNGHEMVQYQSKSGMEAKIAEAASVLGGQQTEFDRLLNLFQNKTTEEAEIIATLFAAWNDLLIDGKSPSDDQIIREVRENWHYKKERFTPTLLTRWLNWLRQQTVIPRGLAPRTRQQLKLGLS